MHDNKKEIKMSKPTKKYNQDQPKPVYIKLILKHLPID